jgi:polyphosphate kinase 2 (PPK2 family)
MWHNRCSIALLELLEAQYALIADKGFPVVVLVGGVDGAGKGETVNLLNEWMDHGHIQTHASARRPTRSASARPCGASGGPCPPRGR